MKCPACSRDVSPRSPACMYCGKPLPPSARIEAMRAEIEGLRGDLLQRLTRLDADLNQLLDQVAPPAAVPPTAPPPIPVQAPAPVAAPAAAPQRPTEPIRPPAGAPAPGPAAAQPARPPLQPRPAARAPRPPRDRKAEIQLGQKWLLIAGIAVTVLGVAYFLKYSFDRNWVGPAGRVALGYLWGLVFLGGGEFVRRRKYDMFGLYLIGGGLAVFYAASYASSQVYHLMPLSASFVLMGLTTLLAWGLSLAYDTMWLAVLGIAGGFVTPVVLSTGVDRQIPYMAFLSLLNGGILGIALFKRWPLLTILGFTATWLEFTAWYARFYTDAKFWPTLLFVNLFFLVYEAAPFGLDLIRRAARPWRGTVLTSLNAFIAFGYAYATIRAHGDPRWASAVALAYAFVFLLMATLVLRRAGAASAAFTLLIAQAALFLGLAVPILFSRNWITVFWALQAVTLLWAAERTRSRLLGAGALLLLVLAMAKFAVLDLDSFGFRAASFSYAGGFRDRLAERLITEAAVIGATAWFAHRLRRPTALVSGTAASIAVAAVGAVLLFGILNLELLCLGHRAFPAVRTVFATMLWAAFAVGLAAFGRRLGSTLFEAAAWCLLALMLLKYAVFDYDHAFGLTFQLALAGGWTRHLVVRLCAAAVAVSAVVAMRRLCRTGAEAGAQGAVLLGVVLWVLAFWLLNVETASFLHDAAPRARFAAISVLWAAFSLTLMVTGFVRPSLGMRVSAIGLFAATLLKIFLLDMRNVSTPFRILSFIGVGLLLIAASYLYHRYRDRLLPREQPADGKEAA